MEESWSELFEIDGREVTVTFVRRPFREGLEVRIECDGQEWSCGELGYGLTEVRERVAEEVRKRLSSASQREGSDG
jgi:hypothetical protein